MSTAIHVTSLVDIMKVETKEEFETVDADQTKAKKKVRGYEVLTPTLVKAVARSNKTPAGIFTEIVQEIKRGMPATGQPDETEKDCYREQEPLLSQPSVSSGSSKTTKTFYRPQS